MCFLKKTLFLLFVSLNCFAQYQIQGRIIGLPNTKCYLGHYWGNLETIIYKDTAKTNADGFISFEGKNALPEGNYVVKLPNKLQFDLIITNQQNFSFLTNYSNLIGEMQLTNSADNEKLYAYFKYLNQQYSLMQSASNEVKMQYNQAIGLFKNALFADNSLVSKIVKAADEVTVPTPYLTNGKVDSVALLNNYKAHYFDNLDLSDERLIRTSFFEQKFNRYIQNLTYQLPDSLIKTLDLLIEKTKGNQIVRKYIVSKFTALYENPKAIELEAVFVHNAEKNYENAQNLWDKTVLNNVLKRAKSLKPLLIGKKIPNLIATDLLGKEQVLHNQNSKYTILYIYSLNCNHCKEHAPKVVALQRKLAQRGVKFYAIPVENNPTQWRNFIKTNHTESLLNVIDLNKNIDFVNQFNVIEYPTVFVLDANKNIIGKRINPALLEDFINYVERKR